MDKEELEREYFDDVVAEVRQAQKDEEYYEWKQENLSELALEFIQDVDYKKSFDEFCRETFWSIHDR